MKNILKFSGILIFMFVSSLFLVYVHKKTNNEIQVKKETIQIDSIKRSYHLPSIENSINLENPVLISKEFVNVENPTNKILEELVLNLQKELGRKADSLDILKKLYSASLKREYQSEYKDSLIDIKITSFVKGKLDSINLDYTLKPRKIDFYEKTKTVTKYIQDDFNAYIGGQYSSNKILGTITIQDKNMIYQAGFHDKNNWMVGIGFNPFKKNK